MKERKPVFFIVGAPKCGTTALYQYLKEHPEIFLPKKGLDFFGNDLHFMSGNFSEKQYMKYYENTEKYKILGDASVWYLFSQTAAREIKQFNPAAKIIIMLRNPVDVMFSQHNQLIYNGDEDIMDFSQAIYAEKDRKKGFLIPTCLKNLKESLYYKETVRFYEQVKRYLEVFNKEDVLVIIYDDFVKDIEGTYRLVLNFLGVDPYFLPEFKVVNKSKHIRSIALHKMMINPSSWFKKIVKTILPFKYFRHHLMETLFRINVKFRKLPKMDKSIRKSLQNEFVDEINMLSTLLNKDLSYWR